MTKEWLRRHRRLLSWVAGSVAALLVVTAGSGYLLLRHLNDNLRQVNLAALIGQQPATSSAGGENILILGTVSQLKATGSPLIVHIPASSTAPVDLMSISGLSVVKIPSCRKANGTMSKPGKGELYKSFLLPGQTGLGMACLVKTIEQDTGIGIDHFIESDFSGFKTMIDVLGGVTACDATGWTDPGSKVTFPAGCHFLDSKQALDFAVDGYGTGAYDYQSDVAEHNANQLNFLTALISRLKDKLDDPVAVYKFADAITKSVTVDTQLGGVKGLYDLGQQLRAIPATRFDTFSVPTGGVPTTWQQPQAKEIFAAIRADQPVSSAITSG